MLSLFEAKIAIIAAKLVQLNADPNQYLFVQEFAAASGVMSTPERAYINFLLLILVAVLGCSSSPDMVVKVGPAASGMAAGVPRASPPAEKTGAGGAMSSNW